MQRFSTTQEIMRFWLEVPKAFRPENLEKFLVKLPGTFVIDGLDGKIYVTDGETFIRIPVEYMPEKSVQTFRATKTIPVVDLQFQLIAEMRRQIALTIDPEFFVISFAQLQEINQEIAEQFFSQILDFFIDRDRVVYEVVNPELETSIVKVEFSEDSSGRFSLNFVSYFTSDYIQSSQHGTIAYYQDCFTQQLLMLIDGEISE